jgi:phosphatidylserine/phosphatidylglycerophosphate/cardiolipin synthase-like enzyme
MRSRGIPFLLVLVALAIQLGFFSPEARATDVAAEGRISVYFSPHGGATEALVEAINGARREVLVLAYSFTSIPIAKSLVLAHNRGVHVEAVLDKSQETENYSAADFLSNMGIPTYIDSQHPIQHNKVVCIDREILSTGSFNLSHAGESNAENLLIFRGNTALVNLYVTNFLEHRSHSRSYKGRGAATDDEGNHKKSSSWRSLLDRFGK